MFIKSIVKTDKNTGKQYNYLRLCESYRIGSKIRHRSILTLGKLEGITTREDKKQLADLIESKIKGIKQLPLFSVKPEIEQYATEFSNRIIEKQLVDIDINSSQSDTKIPPGKEQETVNINSLRHDDVREIGAEWLCRQAIEQLGLKDFLIQRCGFSQSSANLSLMHLVSRAVYPASEHKTAQWIKENSAVANLFDIPLDKVNRFKLYSASNALYKNKVRIEDWLSHRTNELFDIHDKIVFYDLTNTYFEGRKAGSTLAKFGKSKEKRSDSKIVALAAVINAEGFLKTSRIYQGNIGDSTTLEQTINDLSLHTSTTGRKPVVVMDAGIISDENALMLKEKGYDYICVSRKRLKEYEQINPEKNNTKIHDKKGNPIELKLVSIPGDEDTYMYVHSQQKAVKEQSMNDHFCQRYEEELDKIGAALHKKGGTKKYEKVWERI
ncbi:MAG: transposase, partial [Pseudomonadota bacterium]|nr:transposase [Pseudomonadota bacterium]